MIMGVSVSVVLMLLPLGFFYKYVYDKYGVDYAYAFFNKYDCFIDINCIIFVIWGLSMIFDNLSYK